jgi:hypothetical protein
LCDGFEGDALAAFWLPGDYGSGLHTPDAIRLTTNFARSGAYAAQITIHQGDIAAAGDADTTVERDELDSGHYHSRTALAHCVCGTPSPLRFMMNCLYEYNNDSEAEQGTRNHQRYECRVV